MEKKGRLYCWRQRSVQAESRTPGWSWHRRGRPNNFHTDNFKNSIYIKYYYHSDVCPFLSVVPVVLDDTFKISGQVLKQVCQIQFIGRIKRVAQLEKLLYILTATVR